MPRKKRPREHIIADLSVNVLNRQAIEIFAKFKNDVLSQLQGVIRHHG
jgi:hypothetical protein